MNAPAPYVSKPRGVLAIQFDGRNAAAVKEFGAPRISDGKGGLLWADLQHGGMAIRPGEWVVKAGRGLTVLSDQVFHKFYEQHPA